MFEAPMWRIFYSYLLNIYVSLLYTYGTVTFAPGGRSGGAWVTRYNRPNIGIFAKIRYILGLSK